ncbi:MAG: nucleotidyltransferase domain-containing protein [Armatimonadetes bacterium]|nr:nucleotidyltransferase domain-containing protein [Armatimonadota bacterium]
MTTDAERRSSPNALIRRIVRRIAEEYAPERVILFGSYASGSPGPDSDIDLLIIKDTPERFIDRWTTVRKIVSDPKRKVPVDTIVLTPEELSQRLRIGDQFIAEIVEKGKVLYAA